MKGSERHLATLAARCNQIARKCAGPDGFVPLRDLLSHFGARLIIRPLLVEAMLASSQKRIDAANVETSNEWLLLVDSETYPITEDDFVREARGAALHPRLRNTVAHELAHSLAFRAADFGIEFVSSRREVGSPGTNAVRKIEQDTEKLSPLLLIPESEFEKVFPTASDYLGFSELFDLASTCGVSAAVMVNRLDLLTLLGIPRMLMRRSARNVLVCVGEWTSDHDLTLRHWPMFSQFDGGNVPKFVFDLQRRRDVSLREVFWCGVTEQVDPGTRTLNRCDLPGGTPRQPELLSVPFEWKVQSGVPKRGKKALFAGQVPWGP